MNVNNTHTHTHKRTHAHRMTRMTGPDYYAVTLRLPYTYNKEFAYSTYAVYIMCPMAPLTASFRQTDTQQLPPVFITVSKYENRPSRLRVEWFGVISRTLLCCLDLLLCHSVVGGECIIILTVLPGVIRERVGR